MRKTLFLFLLLPSFLPLYGKKDDIDPDRFRSIADELRCPTCTGLSVLGSDAKFSVQIKDQVKQQMKEGRSRDEILEFFVARYGPWILREPPKKGFGVWAWLIPICILIFGPILIWFFVWRRRIDIETFGARSDNDIIAEMNTALAKMRDK